MDDTMLRDDVKVTVNTHTARGVLPDGRRYEHHCTGGVCTLMAQLRQAGIALPAEDTAHDD